MRCVAAACLVIAVAPRSVEAQGFGVYEHGACAMARAGAGVAEPCPDGSAIYFNPAGLTGPRGPVISGPGTLIFGSSTFEADAGPATTTHNGAQFAPLGYFRYGLGDRVAVGVGLYAPYGLGVRWPLSFSGRFVSYDSTLETIYVQPTAAYTTRNGRVSVGGGLVVAVSKVDLNRREDLAPVPLGIGGLTFGSLVDSGTDFEDTALKSSRATGLGANVGIIVNASDRFRVGARYLTRVTLSYDGTAAFTPVPGTIRVTKPNPLGLPVGTPIDGLVGLVQSALVDQPIATELPMPAQFIAGVSYHVTPRVTLLGDYQWVEWSAFDTVKLDFSLRLPANEVLVQNYRNTSGIRIGMDVKARPSVTLRAGYTFNAAAAPDETVTPLLPEASRNHITGGVGWTPWSQWSFDVAYQFIAHADRRGRTVNPPSGTAATTGLNSGVYRSRSDLIGFSVTYRP